MLCLTGCIVALEAMGHRMSMARRIWDQEAGNMLRVKSNYKVLHDCPADTFRLKRAEGFVGRSCDYCGDG